MRKLILTAAAVIVSLNVYAQGTVNFANDANSLVINSLTGNPATAGDGILAGLYWAPLSDPNNLTQLQAAAPVAPVPVPTQAGRIAGGTRTTGAETAPGAMAMFQIRAWEAAYGSTYEAASSAPVMGGRFALRGESAVIMNGTGGAGVPPSPPASLDGMALGPTVLVVPEPSVIALGVLGAGALLLLRRRK